MNSNAIPYFRHDSTLSLKEESLFNYFIVRETPSKALEAYALYMLIKMKIYSTEGYYIYYDDSLLSTLARTTGSKASLVHKVVEACLKVELLDPKMYKEHKILTSYVIQSEYFNAIKRRTVHDFILEFMYKPFREKIENEIKNEKNVCKNGENVNNNDERRVEFLDLNNINGENINLDNKTQADSLSQKNISTEELYKAYKQFKEKYPDKCKCSINQIPIFINFDLLTKEIEESPQFLKPNNNIDLTWLIKNYEKVISGAYRKFKSEKTNAEKPVQNYKNRDYSGKNLNNLFDDLTKVKL